MASRSQQLRVVISGDASQLKRAFATAESSAAKFERGMGSTMSRVGTAMRHLSMGALAGAGFGLTALVKAGVDYEKQMARVKAVTGATGGQFKSLGNLAKQLGKDTKFSAGEAAQAMYELGSAGFKASEMAAVLPGTLALAAASSIDLADAAEISSNALRGFGLASDQSTHVADVLAKAVAASSVEMQDLQLSLKYIGPVAKLTGQSFEDMIAALELMGNAGIKGEQAGTTLRGGLVRLTKPTKMVTEGLDSIGLSARDLQGPKGLKPLPQIIALLESHTNKLTKAQRNTALAQIFGTEALSGMSVVVEKGSVALKHLGKENVNADGAAKKMAATMNNTVAGAFENLTGSIETVGITIFEKFQVPVRNALLSIAGTINTFPTLFRTLKDGGRDTATALVEAFGSVFGLDSNNQKLSGALEDMFKQVDWAGIGSTIADGISGGVKLSGQFASSVASGISLALSKINGRKLLSGLLRVVSEAIDAVFSPSFWVDNFKNIFATVTIAVPIAKILKIPGANFLFQHISKPVFKGIELVGRGLVGVFGKVASQGFTGFLAGLEQFAPKTAHVLLSLVTDSGRWLSGLPGKFRGAGSRAVDGLVGAIGKGASAVAGVVGSLLGRVVSPLEKLASRAFAAGKAAISAFGRGLKSLIPHFDISLNPLHPHFRVTFGAGKQTGGLIPGSGRGDTVPAMLEPGEFVMRRSVVDRFGPTFFAGLNGGMGDSTQRFTSGGIVQRANRMDAMTLPYLWGGGHGGPINRGVDCSGAVSYALGVSPRVSGQFTSFGLPGPGSQNDTKVYANAEHVFAVFNGRGWGTSHENPGGGPGWLSYNSRPGFTIRHLEDSAGSRGGTGQAQESASREALQARVDANLDKLSGLRNKLAGVPSGKAHAGTRKAIQAQIRGLVSSNRALRTDMRHAPTSADRTAAQERAGSRLVNQITAPFAKSLAASAGGAATLGTAIDDEGTRYGQVERMFGQTDEDLGTAGGRKHRISELVALAVLKKKTLGDQKKRAGMLKRAISTLEAELKKLRAARDKAHGAKRAKMNDRIAPIVTRLDDLKAELKTLGFAIHDTELDIGDLAKEEKDVAGTADTAVEPDTVAIDKVSGAMSDIDLMEHAGILTADQATAMRVATLKGAEEGKFGALSPRQMLDVMGQMRDATQAQTDAALAAAQAVSDQTQALRDLKASIDQQNAISGSIVGVELATAQRVIGDMFSNQIGTRTANRAMLPGTGALSRL
jgi:TP901 family phage tail tape measure protein